VSPNTKIEIQRTNTKYPSRHAKKHDAVFLVGVESWIHAAVAAKTKNSAFFEIQ